MTRPGDTDGILPLEPISIHVRDASTEKEHTLRVVPDVNGMTIELTNGNHRSVVIDIDDDELRVYMTSFCGEVYKGPVGRIDI